MSSQLQKSVGRLKAVWGGLKWGRCLLKVVLVPSMLNTVHVPFGKVRYFID